MKLIWRSSELKRDKISFEPLSGETRNLACYVIEEEEKNEQLLLTPLSVKYVVVCNMTATHKSVSHPVEQLIYREKENGRMEVSMNSDSKYTRVVRTDAV